jgi:transposase
MENLARFLVLPELEILSSFRLGRWGIGIKAKKVSDCEVCPKCATLSGQVHSRRKVRIKDEPLRNKAIVLFIEKRRFYCEHCKKPFTEPIPGIKKGARSTQRLKAGVCWAAERFMNLTQVEKNYRCSAKFVYQSFYRQLELRRRRDHQYPFPEKLCLDEHSLRKKKYQSVDFVTMVVDQKNRKLFEVIDGKDVDTLTKALADKPGRERVKVVCMDMSPVYKSFVESFFENAKIVNDRFHVQRLFTKLVNYHRKCATGDDRKNPIRKLLLRERRKLKPYEKRAITKWLAQYPQIKEVYEYKEQMHRIYRMRGYQRAKLHFTKMLDQMAKSTVARVATLRTTLLQWKKEILQFFVTRISNGRTEGFNRKAKLIQRASYGFKNFENYRARLLNACGPRV